MKKKLFTILLTGVMALSITACSVSDAMLTTVYNTETYDYSEYEAVRIQNAEFYLPAECIKEYGICDENVFYAINDNYLIYAENMTSSIFDTDDAKLADNVEAYVYEEGIDLRVSEANIVSVSLDSSKKVIFKKVTASLDGVAYEGEVAVVAGKGFEILLVVLDNAYLGANEVNTAAKSFSNYTGSALSYKIFENTAPAETQAAAEKSTEETEAATEKEVEETEAATEAEAKDSAKKAADRETELSDDLYSYQVKIDGNVYQLPMWFSDLEAMGWKYNGENRGEELQSYSYLIYEEWKKDGMVIHTDIVNMSANNALLEECIIGAITIEKEYGDTTRLEEAEIELPCGIKLFEAGYEDIKEAYGEPNDEYSGEMYDKLTYYYDYNQEIELYVFKESGALEQIEISNFVELEGIDNSINEEIPETVLDYVADSRISDDFSGFSLELDGKIYTLPCPVTEFIDEGWTIDKRNTDEAAPAQGTCWVTLKKGNRQMRFMAKNYATYATIPENLFCTSIEAGGYDEKNMDIEVVGGITIGTSEADLKKVLENSSLKATKEEVDDYTYYTIENDSYSSTYEFTVTEGKVYEIEVTNLLSYSEYVE